MKTWFSEREFFKTKMVKVIKGLVIRIDENLDHYFTENTFIEATKIFDIQKFIKTHDPDFNTYGIGNSELIDLC